MSGILQSRTARLFLDRLPHDERPIVVRDIAKSLSIEDGRSDVAFAATLLLHEPDDDARRHISEHLRLLTEAGRLETVFAVCRENPVFLSDLLCFAFDRMKSNAERLDGAGRSWTVVPMPGSISQAPESDELWRSRVTETIHYLQLSNRLRRLPLEMKISPDALQEPWILPSLQLLGSTDKTLRTAAQESLDLSLSIEAEIPSHCHFAIWNRIRTLITSDDPTCRSIGAFLWLRWISSGHRVPIEIWQTDAYWTSLLDGMRHGDSERRKACLQILRVSMDVCAMDPTLLPMITVRSHSSQSKCFRNSSAYNTLFFQIKSTALQVGTYLLSRADFRVASMDVQKQYARFCNVFETIVLGRYLNQVQQCEADLDFLTSSKSVVKSVWLYTLLACALEQKMQDSNRKFIGSWIMRSRLRVDDPDSFINFLQLDLLPWAMSGFLFTTTLRNDAGHPYCEHGERISAYVAQLLNSDPDVSGRVVDTIIKTVHTRHANTFAYAIVYLIDGIGKALDSAEAIDLDEAQLGKIQEIGTWLHIPEVARDYILSRSWKLCYQHIQRHGGGQGSAQIASGAARWAKLLERAPGLTCASSVHKDGSISSMALPASKRDINERAAHEKCSSLSQALEGDATSATSDSSITEQLSEIWNDLEYTEYPKNLLKALPRAVMGRDLIKACSEANDGELAATVAQKTQHLFELAASRSYMLPALIEALRDVVLTEARAASLLQLSNLVMYVADHPSSATIDAQLEATTIPLLASLDPMLKSYSYEYYFGQRETVGFAAFLDLVSRVGGVDSELPRQILDQLLQRWVSQKVPPPSVSSWKTILQLQVMVLCAEQTLGRLDIDQARRMLKELHYVLAIEPLPRYRYLLEWMIARTYIHHPGLRPSIFEELRTKDHHSNPKFLASLMKIGVRIAHTHDADEDFALQLATVFVPLAASSKVVIRHEAQWQVPILLDHVRCKQWTSVTSNTAFEALDEFIRSLERYGDPPQERLIDNFDPVSDNTLTHLVEGPWHDLDNVEARLCSHADFNSLPTSPSYPPSCIPLGSPLVPPPPQPLSSSSPASPDPTSQTHRRLLQNLDNISRALGSGPGPSTLAVQTKGTAYLSSTPTRTRFRTLLVIASLVDNPHNLGGLSRVSEIFGAGALYIPTPTVMSSKDFQSVAVASHLHIPVHSLAAEGLQEFLQKRKREEGFQVVGIEQTDRSVLIGRAECVLPEKCILVLGSEREGIPAAVLGECDLLVEIPQVGVTRSLNVQTAAGIVLCEYVRQFGQKKK